MTTPYTDLPPARFWRAAVAERHPTEMSDLYSKAFDIDPADRVATAGSCFAQHVARRLASRRFNVVDAERAPMEMPDALARSYGYGLYSARYGNLYTARQLLQLIEDAETGTAREEDVWETDGRFYDALRPSVEPKGLDSREEALAHRRRHLAIVDRLFSEIDVLIFTLGLTETWIDRRSGTVYPTCPGVVAGRFDPEIHAFRNLGFPDVYEDILAINAKLAARNPGFRMLLTVSPVPLTATASGGHVLPATVYSKSVLRAVCGAAAQACGDIGYFPSYEIIASPSSRGMFYEPNLRSVTELGVETVMKVFFEAHPEPARPESEPVALPAPEPARREEPKRKTGKKARRREELVCEEMLLDAFSRS